MATNNTPNDKVFDTGNPQRDMSLSMAVRQAMAMARKYGTDHEVSAALEETTRLLVVLGTQIKVMRQDMIKRAAAVTKQIAEAEKVLQKPAPLTIEALIAEMLKHPPTPDEIAAAQRRTGIGLGNDWSDVVETDDEGDEPSAEDIAAARKRTGI